MQNLRFGVIKLVKKNRKYLDSTGQFFVKETNGDEEEVKRPDIDNNTTKIIVLENDKIYDELEWDGARLHSIEWNNNSDKEKKEEKKGESSSNGNNKRVVKIELSNGPKYLVYSIFDHIVSQVVRWCELICSSSSNQGGQGARQRRF